MSEVPRIGVKVHTGFGSKTIESADIILLRQIRNAVRWTAVFMSLSALAFVITLISIIVSVPH